MSVEDKQKNERVAEGQATGQDIKGKESGAAKKKKEKGGSRNTLVLIVISLLILIALVVLIVVVLAKDDDGNSDNEVTQAPNRNVIITDDNLEEALEQISEMEPTQEGYYTCQMDTVWHFSKGDGVSEDAYVKNDAGNTNDVYFDVFLKSDESTPILESPIIPRGAQMRDIVLDVPLDAGTHECIMVYHLVDDEQTTVSTLRVKFYIIVEE